MRLTLAHAPCFILFCLPFVIAFNGYGIFVTTLLMVCWLVFQLFTTLASKMKPPVDDRFVLHTFPLSHYVEKARWCMDKTGLPYKEEKDIGVFWFITTGRMVPLLRNLKQDISIPNSSDILKYLYGHMLTQDEEKAKFLKPSVKSKEMEMDIDKMGAKIRRYIYYNVLVASKDVERTALKGWGLHEEDIPTWQKTILKVVWPILRQFVLRALKVTKENVDEDLRKLTTYFEETDKILSNNKYLLGTDEPTYIDISFASLAALLVLPDQYGGARLSPETRLKLSDFSPEVQDRMMKFRESVSGKFVSRMYAEHR